MMEIAVAVVLLVMLAGVLTPLVGSSIEDSRRARAQEDCKSIASALGSYREDHGAYPPGVQGNPRYNYANLAYYNFGAEVLNPWLFEGPKKYLKRPIANDPWGTPYNYHVYALSDPYMDVCVFSNGPNRECQTWDGAMWNRGRFNGDDIGAFFDVAR